MISSSTIQKTVLIYKQNGRHQKQYLWLLSEFSISDKKLRQKQWQTVKWWYCKTVVCRNLSCSIKEGRKQSHPRSKVASAKMSSNLKKNCTWCTVYSSTSKEIRDQRQNKPSSELFKTPYWSDLDKKDEDAKWKVTVACITKNCTPAWLIFIFSSHS